MNFNFNNQRTKFHIGPPIMRHFSTFGLVTTKPEASEYIQKPDYILKNVQNNFFSTFQTNVLPNKSFTNPNFVNKQNPNILTPSVAGAFKLSNCHESPKHCHTQQPKHDNYKHTTEICNQSLPEANSSQNCPSVHTEMPTIEPLSPKSTKKIRNRNRRNKKNAKRQKQDSISLEPIKKKFSCSSPKKLKKESKKRRTKKCKPWHKINFNKEIMECEEPPTPDTENFETPKDFCLQISSPIEISPKCNIISESLSISFSPEFLKTLSTSSSSEVMSCSPSSPAIRRLRIPSECDSEDSFIVFCDDGDLSEETSTEEEETDSDISESSSDDSDFPAKKKVTFADDSDLCTVHPMVQWGYAYHAARRGPWEEIARDRARFESRIRNTGNVLGAVLDPEHREKVYRDRFQE